MGSFKKCTIAWLLFLKILPGIAFKGFYHPLFGEVTNDALTKSFLKYLSTSESEVVEAALRCRYISTIFYFGNWAKVPKMESILHDTQDINMNIYPLLRWLFLRYIIRFLRLT